MNAKAKTKKTAPASGVKYQLTGKEYRPKAPHNVRAFERIASQLTKGPKTLGQLRTSLEYTDEEMEKSKQDGELPLKQQKHHDFIGYMERGGFIEPVKN